MFLFRSLLVAEDEDLPSNFRGWPSKNTVKQVTLDAPSSGNHFSLASADCLHQIRKHVRAKSEPHPNRIRTASETMAEVKGDEASSNSIPKFTENLGVNLHPSNSGVWVERGCPNRKFAIAAISNCKNKHLKNKQKTQDISITLKGNFKLSLF